MQQLLESDQFTIQSKIKWFPSFKTKFDIVTDEGESIGQIHFHPVLMAPVLWFFGLLLELGLVGGGLYFVLKGENNAKFVGGVMLLIGALLMFLVKFRTFLSSRASSYVEILDASGTQLLEARKGWALWRPTFTVHDTQADEPLGQSRQSFLWGDCHYSLWDSEGKDWGSIRRRPWGFQYRVYHNNEQVARFRRKLIDARKLITGLRSYKLEYQQPDLTPKERALILGTIAYADVLTRQKKLRDDKEANAAAQPTSPKAK